MARLTERKIMGLVAILPLIVYLNSLSNPFHYDDGHSIVDNPHVRSLANVPSFFADPSMFSGDPEISMYRPFLLVTYALNYAISGYDVWTYHLVSILLHVASVWAVYALARALHLAPAAAAFAAIAFGLHPIHTEAVNYISSRSELLASLCVLLGMWVHTRYGDRRWGGVAVAVALAVGLTSKSTAIVLPALILCLDGLGLCHHGVNGRASMMRRVWSTYVLLAAVTAAYLITAGRFLRTAAVESPVRSYDEQIWSQTKALVLYLKLLLAPRGLSVDHQFLVSDTLWDPFAAGAFLVIASLLGLAWRHRRVLPLALFLVLWWGLALAPSSLVPLNVLVNEHRLYLPGAAFAIGLGLVVRQVLAVKGNGRRSGLLPILLVAALVVSGCLTVQRNQVWSSRYLLWEDAAAQAPLMARPMIILGEAHAQDGHTDRAIAHLETALERDPEYLAGYEALGRLYRDTGQVDRAEARLRQGLARDSTGAELWGGLAALYVQRGQQEAEPEVAQKWMGQALAAYLRATELAPDDHTYQDNLGNTYQELNRPAEALRHHRRALELQPGDVRTLCNLGNAHHMLGDVEVAAGLYRQALIIDPGYAGAWLNLGSALEAQALPQEALAAYERAASLDLSFRALVDQRRGQLQGGR